MFIALVDQPLYTETIKQDKGGSKMGNIIEKMGQRLQQKDKNIYIFSTEKKCQKKNFTGGC